MFDPYRILARESWTRPLLVICLVAFAARVLVAILLPEQGFSDAGTYAGAGRDLFVTGIITNDYVMPLYPVWTYVWNGIIGVGVADALVSTATVWMLGTLSFEVLQHRTAAILAAMIAAVYPHFLFFSAIGLTETLYLFLLTFGFLLLYRRYMGWGSLVLAVSLLVRPTLELAMPVVILAVSVCIHREGYRVALRRLGVYAIIYCAVLAPWWVHNYMKYDRFVRLTLSAGPVLYAGNNPLNQSGGGVMPTPGHAGDVDFSRFYDIDDPVVRSKAMWDAGVDYIVAKPAHFVYMMGVKFQRFWRLWPYARDYNQWHYIVASLLSYGLMLFAALAFWIQYGRRYWRRCVPILVVVGFLTTVHMITIGSVRYRIPLEGFVIMFGTYWLINTPLARRLTR